MADLISLYNYLVPAAGGTHGYPLTQNFSAAPFDVDFRFVELDGETFVPYGVFIDNSAGIGDLVITILASDYSITCPAGGRLQASYPAPSSQQIQITGNGTASLMFVDFPVLPFIQQSASALGAVTIADGADVALGDTADAAAVAPYATATVIAMLKAMAAQLDLQTPDIDALRISNASLLTIATPPAAGAMTSVALTGASQVVLASNANRKGCVIFNDSVNVLYLRLEAAAASAANFTLELNPRDSLTLRPGEYTGEIRGFSSAASGNARVTEFS